MQDRLISTNPTAGFRQVGIGGQPVVESHHQLTSILSRRLSAQHAAMFALPRVDPKGQRIDWYCSLPGSVTQASELPSDQETDIRARADRFEADIRDLASNLSQTGGASELVARMLLAALVTPGPEHLYAVGTQPVLTMWGHEAERGAVIPLSPNLPAAPAWQPAPLVAAARPSMTVSTLSTGANRRGLVGWLLWLLPLLLFLLVAVLFIRACEPLEPRVVEVPDPNPPPRVPDPTPDLEERRKALESERNLLAQERESLANRCVADNTQNIWPLRKPTVPAEPLPPPPAIQPPNDPPDPKADLPKTEVPPVKPSPKAPQRTQEPSCTPSYGPGDEPEVVIVVDGSASMNEPFLGAASRIEQARRSINSLIDGMPRGIDIGLVEFRGCNNVRRDKFYSDSERGQLKGEVNSISPWGGTPLARSIERAGNILSNDVESVVVIISDGGDSCGGDPCAAARALKAAKPKVVVNVIDISGDARGRAVMQCVARVTGGQVLQPNSPADFAKKMQQASRQPDARACKR